MKHVYQGMVQGSKKVTYHLMSKAEALNWYSVVQFLMDQRSIYLLKADYVYELENDLYMVFTDAIEDTLRTYVKKNKQNLVDPNTGEATKELKQILWDAVKGLTYLKTEHNRDHGNLSADSIFIVNGRGRLGRFYMDPPPGASQSQLLPTSDIDAFVNLLRFMCPAGVTAESTNLKHLYGRLNLPEDLQPGRVLQARASFFYRCDCHSALISWEEKAAFRHKAILAIRRSGLLAFKYAESFLDLLFPQKPEWQKNIPPGPYYAVLTKDTTPANSQNPPTPGEVQYADNAMSFLVYSRNLVEHHHQYSFVDTLEEVECKLESFLPRCLGYLLEVLISMGINVKIH